MNADPPMSGGQSAQQISTISSLYQQILPSQLAPVNNLLANERIMKGLSSSSTFNALSLSTISSFIDEQNQVNALETSIQNRLSTLYFYSQPTLLSTLYYMNITNFNIQLNEAATAADIAELSINNSKMQSLNTEITANNNALPNARYNYINALAAYQANYSLYSSSLSTYSGLSTSISSQLFLYTSTLLWARSQSTVIGLSTMSTNALLYSTIQLEIVGLNQLLEILASEANLIKPVVQSGGGVTDTSSLLYKYSQPEYDLLSTMVNYGNVSSLYPYINSTIALGNHMNISIIGPQLANLYSISTTTGMKVYGEISSICTIVQNTLPNQYNDLSTLSSIQKYYCTAVAYSTMLLYYNQSTIKGLANPISTLTEQQAIQQWYKLSTQMQITQLQSIYSTNIYYLNLYTTALAAGSTYSLLNSTTTLFNEVTELLQLISEGVPLSELNLPNFNIINNVQVGGQQTQQSQQTVLTADTLQIIYNTLSISREILQAKHTVEVRTYKDAQDMLINTGTPDPKDYVGQIEAQVNIADGFIYSTIAEYATLVKALGATSTLMLAGQQNLASLQASVITDDYIDSAVNGMTVTYKENVCTLVRQIAVSNNAVISLENSMAQYSILTQEYMNLINIYTTQQKNLNSEITATNLEITTQQLELAISQNSIYQISTWSYASSLNTSPYMQRFYSEAAMFNLNSITFCQSLSTYYGIEYLNSINTTALLSSQIMIDILEKRMNIARGNLQLLTVPDQQGYYVKTVSGITTSTLIVGSLVQTEIDIDTINAPLEGNFLPNFKNLFTLIQYEYLLKQYYIIVRREYEYQSYLKFVPGQFIIHTPAQSNTVPQMTTTAFNSLEINYDVIIQSINKVVNAKNVYMANTFIPALNPIVNLMSTIMEGSQWNYLTNITQYTDPDSGLISILSSIIPFTLPYTYVSTRGILFIDPAEILPPTMEVCASTFFQVSTLSSPTSVVRYRETTIVTKQMSKNTSTGVRGRYIQISNDTNDLEIMQVIVIDGTGKNVAFGKRATISPTSLQLIHAADLNYITNGNYSREAFMAMVESMNTTFYTRYMFVSPSVENETNALPNSKIVTIDLGNLYDINAIQYLRFTNEYTSVGMKFTIYDSNMIPVASQNLLANTEMETLDFRGWSDTSHLEQVRLSQDQKIRSAQTGTLPVATSTIIDRNGNAVTVLNTMMNPFGLRSNIGPTAINPTRYGICGTYAQYVRLYIPRVDGAVVPNYKFAIAQIAVIAVVDSMATNVAVNKTCRLFTNSSYSSIDNTTTLGGANTCYSYKSDPIGSDIINRTFYRALPLEDCYVSGTTFTTTNSYIEINLGQEYDITAVQLYNTSDPDNNMYQKGINIALYTADKLLAIESPTITNNRKEIVTFISPTSELSAGCPIEPIWPSYYGEAGVIARYVRLMLNVAGYIGFAKVEIIDRMGRDVGMFMPVTAKTANPANPATIAVSNQTGAQMSQNCYISGGSGAGQFLIVDLRSVYEICAVNVYGSIDVPSYTRNIQLELLDANSVPIPLPPTILKGCREKESFDFRYNPENSEYPTSVTLVTTRYGTFGTMADTVVFPGPLNTRDPNFSITDSTGRNLMNLPTTTVTADPTNTRTVVEFGYMADVTAVTMSPSSSQPDNIILYNCTGNVVASLGFKTGQMMSTFGGVTLQSTISYADLRNTSNLNSATYAPIIPFKQRPGPHGVGVQVQYIRAIPANVNTPLYISQILAVDASGINIAFDADTFSKDSSILTTTGNAVDGVYEAQLDDYDFPKLFFQKYRQRPANESFVSNPGAQESNFWIADLGGVYEINSVVYVATQGHNSDCSGVIIQLIDNNLNVVGVQQVSNLISVFGIDIIDFRLNPTMPYTNPYSYLEVRPRLVVTGQTSCGVMAQYIRILYLPTPLCTTAIDATSRSPADGGPLTPLQLSQVVALDSYGRNIALFKQVYATKNILQAYMIADGNYYMKNDNTDGYVSNLDKNGKSSTPTANDYIEINFGSELELVSLYLINLKSNQNYINNIKIQVFNGSRDIILDQPARSLASSQATANVVAYNTNLDNQTFNSFRTYGQNTIGVQLVQPLMELKISQGYAPPTIQNGSPVQLPPVATNPISNTTCLYDLNNTNLFTRDNAGGIPTSTIRLYNVDQFIQISQIMAFDSTGANVAYKKPCHTTSVLPGSYIERVTDGDGGFFHVPRPENKSFISNCKQYDMVDIYLGSIKNIVGVKYIAPTTNLYRNVGLRVQLIDQNGVTVAQKIIDNSNANTALLDFRLEGSKPPIAQLVMPPINTISAIGLNILNTPTPAVFTPNGMAEDSNGNIYVSNVADFGTPAVTNPGSITCITQSGSAIWLPAGQLKYPAGLACDSTNLYIADYGNNALVAMPLAIPAFWGNTSGPITTILSPMSVTGTQNKYDIASVITKNIYSLPLSVSFTVTLQPGFGAFVGLSGSGISKDSIDFSITNGFGYYLNSINSFISSNFWAGLFISSGTSTGIIDVFRNNFGANRMNTLQTTSGTAYTISRPLTGSFTTGTFTIKLTSNNPGSTVSYYYNGTLINTFTDVKLYSSAYLAVVTNTGSVNNIGFSLTGEVPAPPPSNAPTAISILTKANTTITNPYGLFYDAVGKILYCTEYKMNGRIFKYNTLNNSFTILTPTFNFPSSIILTKNNVLYVSSAYDKMVYSITTNTNGTVTVLSAIGNQYASISSMSSLTSFNCSNSYISSISWYSPTTVTSSFPNAQLSSVGLTCSVPSIPISLRSPSGLAYDSMNNIIFISDYVNEQVYSIDSTRTVQRIAGSGTAGYLGDGKQGIFAQLNKPINVYFSQTQGCLFISDFFNNSIRYLNLNTKAPLTITPTTTYDHPSYYTTTTLGQTPDITVGNIPPPPDPMTNIVTVPRSPPGIAKVPLGSTSTNITAFYIDPATNILYFSIGSSIYKYILTNTSSQVCTISSFVSSFMNVLQSNLLFTVTSANGTPYISCITKNGNNLYICDKFNSMIYQISLNNPLTQTAYMGVQSTAGWNGDGQSPTNTYLSSPSWIAFNNNGLLYVSDTGNFCIRRVSVLQRVQTIVGNNVPAGAPQPTAPLSYPNPNIRALPSALYTVEQGAYSTRLHTPTGFAFDSVNNLIFCDSVTNTVYTVSESGRLNLVCGSSTTPTPWLESNITTALTGIPGPSVSLHKPTCVAVDLNNTIYVTSTDGQQIAKITQSQVPSADNSRYITSYTVSIFAGFGTTGTGGYNAADLFAKYATLNMPSAIQYITGTGINAGQIYFLEGENTTGAMVRYITPAIVDTYTKGLEGILPYSPLSVIANYSQNTYNTGTISSIITGQEEPSASMNIFTANAMCVDDAGNIYIANTKRQNILQINTTGQVKSILSGLNNPSGISIYNNSILYISDTDNNRIIQYSLASSASSASSNTNMLFYTGTNKPTVNAIYPIGYLFTIHPNDNKISMISLKGSMPTSLIPIQNPIALTVDSAGNLYVSTASNISVYTITYTNNSATINQTPSIYISNLGYCASITYNPIDNYIYYSSKIYKVVWKYPAYNSNPTPTQIVVAGIPNYSGTPLDGAYANTTTLKDPTGVVIDLYGNLFILDQKTTGDTTLVEVPNLQFLKQGLAYTIAGSCSPSNSIPIQGIQANLNLYGKISGGCFGQDGSVYFSDYMYNCVWKIDSNGILSCAAGVPSSSSGASPTGLTTLYKPMGLAMSKGGILYICDQGNNRVTSITINTPNATLQLVVGPTIPGSSIPLSNPGSVALDMYENIYIADTANNRILMIDSQDVITIIIGGGSTAIANGLNPTNANINSPAQIAFNSKNELHFVNIGTNQVVKLSTVGTLQIVAGNGAIGHTGDNDLATLATLNYPIGLAIDSYDVIYISEMGGNSVSNYMAGYIRMINSSGIITTVVGNGSVETVQANGIQNIDGNGELPANIPLSAPGMLAIDANNRLLITQNSYAKLTLATFTYTNPCGLTGRYLLFQAQGLPLDISWITMYDSKGIPYTSISNRSLIGTPTVIASSNNACAQYVIQSGTTSDFQTVTGGLNEYLQIDLGKDTTISFINIRSLTTNGVGMKFLFINNLQQIVYTDNTTSDTITNTGQYMIFRSQFATTRCTIPSLPVSYNNVTCGVPNVQYIKITNNNTTSCSISQVVAIDVNGANVCLESPTVGLSIITDGFYAAKSNVYTLNSKLSTTIRLVNTGNEILYVLVYFSQTQQASMNSVSIDLLDSNSNSLLVVRYLTGIPIMATPTLQYAILDYRRKSLFNTCVNSYGLIKYKQATKNTYIQQSVPSQIRYVQIWGTGQSWGEGTAVKFLSTLALSYFTVKSADTGEDLALNKPVMLGTNINTIGAFTYLNAGTYSAVNEDLCFISTNVSTMYIEVDLLKEYNIGEVMVYPPLNASRQYDYTIVGFTALRNPVDPSPTSQRDTKTSKIRIQGVGTNFNIQNIQAFSAATYSVNTNTYTENSVQIATIKDPNLVLVPSIGTTVTTAESPLNPGYTVTNYVEITLQNPSYINYIVLNYSTPTPNQKQAQLIQYNSSGTEVGRNSLYGYGNYETIITAPRGGVSYANSILFTPSTAGTIRYTVYGINNNVILTSTLIATTIDPQKVVLGTGVNANTAVFEVSHIVIRGGTDTSPSLTPIITIQLQDTGDVIHTLGSSQTLQGNLPYEILYFNTVESTYFNMPTPIKPSYIPYNPKWSQTYTLPSPYTYTFLSQIGQNRVRYVQYVNTTGTSYISQLIVIDKYGINVAFGKTVNPSTPSSTNYSSGTLSNLVTGVREASSSPCSATGFTSITVDLGGEYEIAFVEYWNTSDTASRGASAGSQVFLLDSFLIKVDSKVLIGGSAAERLDFRLNTTPALPSLSIIKYNTSALTDPFLSKVVRARYVRLENPGLSLLNTDITTVAEPTLMISQVAVYDVFGRNIAVGKPTRSGSGRAGTYFPVNNSASVQPYGSCFVSNAVPGDWWEVDLGDEYSITSLGYYHCDLTSTGPTGIISYTGITGTTGTTGINGIISISNNRYSNIPFALYGRQREEYYRSFINPGPTGTSGPSGPSGTSGLSGLTGPTGTVQLNISQIGSTGPTGISGKGKPVRFIQLVSNTGIIRIRQIVALNSQGFNVAVGKPVRHRWNSNPNGWSNSINSGTTIISKSSGAVDGLFLSENTYKSDIGYKWWEVDLGTGHDIVSIVYYNDISNPDVNMSLYAIDTARNYIPSPLGVMDIINVKQQTLNFTTTSTSITTIPTTVIVPANLQNYGTKARYIRLEKSSGLLTLCQIVVVDSLGRNVAYNKKVSSSPLTSFFSMYRPVTTNGATTYSAVAGNTYPTTPVTNLVNGTLTASLTNIVQVGSISSGTFGITTVSDTNTAPTMTFINPSVALTSFQLVQQSFTNLSPIRNTYTLTFNATSFSQIPIYYSLNVGGTITNIPSTGQTTTQTTINSLTTSITVPSNGSFSIQLNRVLPTVATTATAQQSIPFTTTANDVTSIFNIFTSVPSIIISTIGLTYTTIAGQICIQNTTLYNLSIQAVLTATQTDANTTITSSIFFGNATTSPIESTITDSDNDLYVAKNFKLGIGDYFYTQIKRNPRYIPSGTYNFVIPAYVRFGAYTDTPNTLATLPSTNDQDLPLTTRSNNTTNLRLSRISYYGNTPITGDITNLLSVDYMDIDNTQQGNIIRNVSGFNITFVIEGTLQFGWSSGSNIVSLTDPVPKLPSYTINIIQGSNSVDTTIHTINSSYDPNDTTNQTLNPLYLKKYTFNGITITEIPITVTLKPNDTIRFQFINTSSTNAGTYNYLKGGEVCKKTTTTWYSKSGLSTKTTYTYLSGIIFSGLAEYDIKLRVTSYSFIETNTSLKLTTTYGAIESNCSVKVDNTTNPASFVEVDLGEEHYVKNVTVYSAPRQGPPTNPQIDETVTTFNTDLTGTSIILKDAYQNQTYTPITLYIPTVRYIKYCSNALYDLQCSRLIIKDVNGTDVGLNKPATYLSIHGGAILPLTITNGLDAIANYPNIYHSGWQSPDQYLQIDLGQEFQIGSIKYWNRGDCCQERSAGTFIQLIANNGTTVVQTVYLKGGLPSELFTFKLDRTASNSAGTINGNLPGYADTINF